jgi:hypothetical protein
VVDPPGDVREHRPPGADLRRMPDRGAQTLYTAVRVHDGALLLGVRLGGEHDRGVLANSFGQYRCVRDDEASVVKRALPQRAVRQLADGVSL